MKTYSKFLWLFLLIIGYANLFSQTTLEDLGNFKDKESNFPNTVYYSAASQNYLYLVGTNMFFIYDISTPDSPVFIRTEPLHAVKKIFAGNNLLAVYHGTQIAIYDISTPDLPVALSNYDAGNDLFHVEISDNYMYVLYMHENSKAGTFEIVDITDPSSPVKTDSFKPNNADGFHFCITPDGQKVYTAHFNYSNSKTIISELDISDPANIVNTRTFTKSKMPFKIDYYDDILFILSDSEWKGPSYLSAYDVSGDGDWTELVSEQVASTRAQDMHVVDNSITLSVHNSGVIDYTFDRDNNILTEGEAISFSKSSHMSYYISQTSGNTTALKSSSINEANAESFLEIIYYIMENTESFSGFGGKKIKLIKKKIKIETPDKATLTMAINPTEAQSGGCSVIPAVGQHIYDKETTVQLNAEDNPSGGWIFKDWTGSASGTSKSTSVLMNTDKQATANFKELKLTVQGNKTETICTDEANNETLLMVTHSATAYGDNWIMSGIPLTASGNGIDNDDIKLITVKRDATVLWTGNFPSDDGSVTASFSLPVTIPEGETAVFTIHYELNLTEDDLNRNEVLKYIVKGKAVAKPEHYDEGPIVGSANGEKDIAKVFNTAGYGFMKIQDAINSETTQNGHEIVLCPGTYAENVSVTKELTIRSSSGKDVTFVHGVEGKSKATFEIEANNVKIKDLIIRKGYEGIGIYKFGKLTVENCNIVYNSYAGIQGIDAHRIEVKNCIFTKTTGLTNGAINLINSDNTKIHENTFTNNYYGIDLRKSNNSEIYSNKFNLHTFAIGIAQTKFCKVEKNDIIDSSSDDIKSTEGFRDRISQNTITSSVEKYSDGITLLDADGSWVTQNTISEAINGIKIGDSKNFFVYRNQSYENSWSGIDTYNCNNFLIEENKCWKNWFGIQIRNSEKFVIKRNRLINHTKRVVLTGGWGIYLTEKNRTGGIYDNVMVNNCTGIYLKDDYNGIQLQGNIIHDSFCFLTGIHLSGNGKADITGNYFEGNAGAAIMTEEGAEASVEFNNFYDNDLAVKNTNENITLTADNNYWGTVEPSISDYSGNIQINNWLSSPVNLVAQFNSDSSFVSPGLSDSLNLTVQNLSDPDDEVEVTFSDELNWLIGEKIQTAVMSDTLGADFKIDYTVPDGLEEGTTNKITVNILSKKNEEMNTTANIVLTNYIPSIEYIALTPDSSTIIQNENISFRAIGYDRYENSLDFTQRWSASKGTISENGVFNSEGVDGEVTITVTDEQSGKTNEVLVYVTTEEPVLNEISISPKNLTITQGEIFKFGVKGFNQFGFPIDFAPVWNATDGIISSSGTFITDENTQNCIVKVSDSTGTFTDESEVTINVVTGVEEETSIPREFRLSQNYPNPFNPATTIEYSIAELSNVHLRIYNILGQEIDVLVDELLRPGNYVNHWNAANLSSGIYFCRISAKGKNSTFAKTIKLMLLK